MVWGVASEDAAYPMLEGQPEELGLNDLKVSFSHSETRANPKLPRHRSTVTPLGIRCVPPNT